MAKAAKVLEEVSGECRRRPNSPRPVEHPLSAFFTRCKGCDLSYNDPNVSWRPLLGAGVFMFGVGQQNDAYELIIDGRVVSNFCGNVQAYLLHELENGMSS
jgi:hypothetical protein